MIMAALIGILKMCFALSVVGGCSTFVWGCGSAGMNGIRYSSFGPMMLATLILFLIATISALTLGIT